MASPGAVMARTRAEDISNQAVSPESIFGGAGATGAATVADGPSVEPGTEVPSAHATAKLIPRTKQTRVSRNIGSTRDSVIRSSQSSVGVKTNTPLQPRPFPGGLS